MQRGVKHSDYAEWCGDVGVSPATVNLDVTVARRFAVLTGVTVEDAGPDAVDYWWQHLGRLAPSSRATYLRSLRRFYRWRAVRGGGADPTVALREPKVPRRLPRPVPLRDVALILAFTTGDRQVQLGLAYYCGLRVSEIARLRPADVHTDNEGRDYLLVRGKGDVERRVPIPPEAATMLARYTWPDTTGRTLSVVLRDTMHRLGMPYSAHQLRHTYATTVLEHDRNIVTVQRLLGHSSVATTQVYADVSMDQLHDAVAAAFGQVTHAFPMT